MEVEDRLAAGPLMSVKLTPPSIERINPNPPTTRFCALLGSTQIALA
jgi:hypothetical protein